MNEKFNSEGFLKCLSKGTISKKATLNNNGAYIINVKLFKFRELMRWLKYTLNPSVLCQKINLKEQHLTKLSKLKKHILEMCLKYWFDIMYLKSKTFNNHFCSSSEDTAISSSYYSTLFLFYYFNYCYIIFFSYILIWYSFWASSCHFIIYY